MGALVVVPWRKFGHHRLYVNTESGDRVGWFDLNADELVVNDVRLRWECLAALQHYRQDHAITPISKGGRPTTPSAPPAGSSPVPVPELEQPRLRVVAPPDGAHPGEDCYDLARNRPGQGIRVLADQCWEAEPFRILEAELNGIHTDERSWRLGADGEEAVGRCLGELSAAWRVLHSIPVGKGRSDLDHLAIGPGGVFTVNSKHHPGANVWIAGDNLLVNRRKTPYVHHSRFEATRTRDLLSKVCGCAVPTTAVIAMVGAGGVVVKEQPRDGNVHLLDHEQLPAWLEGRPVKLNAQQIELIYSWARRSMTWL
jgi:hypothetical protein